MPRDHTVIPNHLWLVLPVGDPLQRAVDPGAFKLSVETMSEQITRPKIDDGRGCQKFNEEVLVLDVQVDDVVLAEGDHNVSLLG